MAIRAKVLAAGEGMFRSRSVRTMEAQIRAMPRTEKQTEAVTFDHGRPVIAGTRIPVYYIVQSLAFDEGGLDGFFRDYPWISRDQAEAAIDWLLGYLGYSGDEVDDIPLHWGRE
jgi:uncharacterized protein (DUF433 family)